MDLNKENMKKIRRLILFTILILVGLWNYKLLYAGLKILGHVLLPFAVGGAIAFILNVPMVLIEDKVFKKAKNSQKKWAIKLARTFSFILSLLLVAGLISIVVFVVAPEVWKTLLNLSNMLQETLPKLQARAIRLFEDNPEIVAQIKDMNFDWGKMLGEFMDSFKVGAGSFIGNTFVAVKNIVSGVSTFFISFVFACYLLFQKEKIGRQVKKLMYAFMPRDWTEILIELGSVTQKTFFNFLAGQCVEAVIMGCLFFVTMSIFRLPYAPLVSVLIAFTALIPIFGPFIGCTVGTLLIHMVDPFKGALFVALFFALQQLEENFIYPHVVGTSVGLPPIWVLAAVSIGGSLFGIVGMLLFVPLASVSYTILRGIVNRRLKEKEIEVV